MYFLFPRASSPGLLFKNEVFNHSIVLISALMQPFAPTEQGKASQESITVEPVVGSIWFLPAWSYDNLSQF